MKRLSIISVFLLISIVAFSQQEANNWIFTTNTGLRFDTEPPTVLNNTPISFSFGSSCYSDSDGKLLISTDGNSIWNGSGNTIMNGVGIGGDAGSIQSSLIVPDPSRDNSLYVFAVDKYYGDTENRCFTYSRVNLAGDNGNASVSEKNNLLLSETPEYVTAVKHANGIDFWVVTHEYGNNLFYVYPITKDKGLHADNPKIIPVGRAHEGNISTQGVLKLSPDGKYLASVQSDGFLELFSFNNETGNIISLASAELDHVFSAEFDAESRFLYVNINSNSSPISQILQYDLSQQEYLENEYVVNTAEGDTVFGVLQLGPNRKIYCTKYVRVAPNLRGNHLAIIHNPSRPGAACNFNRVDYQDYPGLYVGEKKLVAGLPNFVTSFLNIPFFTYDSICYGNEVTFDLVNKDNIESVSWSFDDPDSGANTSTDESPTHVFSQPGEYDVSVTVKFNGESYDYSEKVVVNPLPEIDFGSDTIYLYPGAIAPLEVEDIYFSYLWNDGNTNNIYLAGDPGEYTVTVTDDIGCWDRKTVTILPANIYFPNAFTPNGDGLNDVFGPKGANSGLFNIRMFVYNRMGQLMYESPVLDVLGDDTGSFAWDGTKGGELMPVGTYVWVVKFDVEKKKGEFDTEQYSGSVTLLR